MEQHLFQELLEQETMCDVTLSTEVRASIIYWWSHVSIPDLSHFDADPDLRILQCDRYCTLGQVPVPTVPVPTLTVQIFKNIFIKSTLKIYEEI